MLLSVWMHELREVDEKAVGHRLNIFITVRLDTSISADIITSFATIISCRFVFLKEEVEALLKKKVHFIAFLRRKFRF